MLGYGSCREKGGGRLGEEGGWEGKASQGVGWWWGLGGPEKSWRRVTLPVLAPVPQGRRETQSSA